MKFEFDNNIPIYIQLVENLKKYIISGKIKTGERLPSVRELAMQNKVNPNTMQRALSELENIGLIFTERTNGKFVTTDQSIIDKYKKEYAYEITIKFLNEMNSIGFDENLTKKYLSDIKKED